MILQYIQPATQDRRGSISDIFYKEYYEHAAIIDTPNASAAVPIIRGNHYHKLSTQSIFMVSGKLNYWYSSIDPVTNNRSPVKCTNNRSPVKCIELLPFAFITTPAFEIHALEIIEPTVFIAFSRGLRGGSDYESDTFRVDNIIIHD